MSTGSLTSALSDIFNQWIEGELNVSWAYNEVYGEVPGEPSTLISLAFVLAEKQATYLCIWK